MPKNPDLRHLFINTNWANLLEPDAGHPQGIVFQKHLPTKRFRDFREQQRVVNEFLKTVLANIQLSPKALRGLEWAINEITDNVLNHATAVDGGLVHVTAVPPKRRLYFTVADGGRGILSSMNEGFPELKTDGAAIGEAIKAGVTSNPAKGQGNGLAHTLSVAMLSKGKLEILSGRARMLFSPVSLDGGGASTEGFAASERFGGTTVTAMLGIDDYPVEDALGIAGRHGFFETHFEAPDSDALIFHMKAETYGVGTRAAGAEVRTQLQNLIQAAGVRVVVIDWDGVPAIASSFADEAVGKLFVELGPMRFCAAVRNTNMNDFVRGLLDKAVLQRSAQSLVVRRPPR